MRGCFMSPSERPAEMPEANSLRSIPFVQPVSGISSALVDAHTGLIIDCNLPAREPASVCVEAPAASISLFARRIPHCLMKVATLHQTSRACGRFQRSVCNLISITQSLRLMVLRYAPFHWLTRRQTGGRSEKSK